MHGEMFRNRDQGLHQHLIIASLRHATDKLPIDLDHVKIEIAQLPERSCARPEIIQGKCDAAFAHILHKAKDKFRHQNCRAFGNFQN